MRYRRCLVPADGFYEWTGPKGKRRPFLLRRRGPELIAFAGLYERWRDGKGEEIDTVAISLVPPTAQSRRCMTACQLFSRPKLSPLGST
jgi:putative SOS response-associated peptidase YedK